MKLQKTFENLLFNEETKSNMVKALNDKVDLPFFSEKTEAKIFDAVYSVVEDVLKEQLFK